MEHLYSIMLIVVGVILAVKFMKESKIFILPGVYFVFAGIWRIVNSQIKADLFSGTYDIVFKGISALVLIIILIFFGKRYWKESHQNKKMTDSTDEGV